jgi:hypothetical protein
VGEVGAGVVVPGDGVDAVGGGAAVTGAAGAGEVAAAGGEAGTGERGTDPPLSTVGIPSNEANGLRPGSLMNDPFWVA